jgi:hypothetical protein
MRLYQNSIHGTENKEVSEHLPQYSQWSIEGVGWLSPSRSVLPTAAVTARLKILNCVSCGSYGNPFVYLLFVIALDYEIPLSKLGSDIEKCRLPLVSPSPNQSSNIIR